MEVSSQLHGHLTSDFMVPCTVGSKAGTKRGKRRGFLNLPRIHLGQQARKPTYVVFLVIQRTFGHPSFITSSITRPYCPSASKRHVTADHSHCLQTSVLPHKPASLKTLLKVTAGKRTIKKEMSSIWCFHAPQSTDNFTKSYNLTTSSSPVSTETSLFTRTNYLGN